MEELVDHGSSQPTYTVVARRYRPRSFEELIGQDHVSQALSKAIATGRVGHAYLFTGARGVGKTSTARIFAKALSITGDMSPELANEISSAIDSGDDMDVIEIDGASNRRIEEIRQLRSNVNMRPGRARFKIYIIDEVHMLTKEAFNALLKTLEEPPQHVKFIFCTTDPEKIPITILSRCQRFDFVPVQLEAIQKRLTEIAQAEGYSIDTDAVALLARRAAGSMRDSQSLLEQVMSFCSGTITADQVHAMLGTVDESNLQSVVESLRDHNALAAITAVDSAAASGADAGQLTEQLLNYLRDLMAVGIGGGPKSLRFANPAGFAHLKQLADSLGVQTMLCAIQILDEALVRMRTSVSAMTLLEVALVQISQLQHLASIPALLEALNHTKPAEVSQKKKLTVAEARHEVAVTDSKTANELIQPPHLNRSAVQQRLSIAATTAQTANELVKTGEFASPSRPTESTGLVEAGQETGQSRERVPIAVQPHEPAEPDLAKLEADLQAGNAQPPQATSSASHFTDPLEQWKNATQPIEGILSNYCQLVTRVEESAGDSRGRIWRIIFPPGANQARDYCDQPQRKSQLTSAVSALMGSSILLSLEVQPGQAASVQSAPVSSSAERQKKIRELMEIPLVKKICDTLDAEIVKVHSAHQTQPHLRTKKNSQ